MLLCLSVREDRAVSIARMSKTIRLTMVRALPPLLLVAETACITDDRSISA